MCLSGGSPQGGVCLVRRIGNLADAPYRGTRKTQSLSRSCDEVRGHDEFGGLPQDFGPHSTSQGTSRRKHDLTIVVMVFLGGFRFEPHDGSSEAIYVTRDSTDEAGRYSPW